MGRSGLVELNIGGKPYTTTRQTLENSGFLRALTSGSFAAPRDAQGRIFVDRDATPAFDTMLTFLRGALGRTALDRMDLTTRAELVAEAEFYDVPALIAVHESHFAVLLACSTAGREQPSHWLMCAQVDRGRGPPTGRRFGKILAAHAPSSWCPRRLRRAPRQAHAVRRACCGL